MDKRAVYILLTGLIVTLLIVAFGFGYNQFKNQIKADVETGYQVKELKINQGQSVFEIADKLNQADLINSNLYFYWKLFISGSWGSLQSGEYLIDSDSNYEEIIEILTKGSSDQKKVVIKEGWRIEDIDSYLASLGLIERKEFIKADEPENYSNQYSFIDTNSKTLEGYLFPDTYYVLTANDFDPNQLINKMLENFNRRVYLNYQNEELPNQIKTFHQLVTLASLVEKEADSYKDRRLVAGIFIKRLKKDMLLQACSSVNYLFSEPKQILSLDDIAINSEYNTYKQKGLPPTPIASPSLNSIKASLNPKASNYFYFLSDKDGKIYYAGTAKEHEQNKERYLSG
jgi:UPF0755 protein